MSVINISSLNKRQIYKDYMELFWKKIIMEL